MTEQDILTTNKTIESVVKAIRLMERQEAAFYDYLTDNADTIDAAFLKQKIESGISVVVENVELFKTICEMKYSGQLQFLNEKPFRVAIIRLNAAVLQARTALDKDTNQAD